MPAQSLVIKKTISHSTNNNIEPNPTIQKHIISVNVTLFTGISMNNRIDKNLQIEDEKNLIFTTLKPLSV